VSHAMRALSPSRNLTTNPDRKIRQMGAYHMRSRCKALIEIHLRTMPVSNVISRQQRADQLDANAWSKATELSHLNLASASRRCPNDWLEFCQILSLKYLEGKVTSPIASRPLVRRDSPIRNDASSCISGEST